MNDPQNDNPLPSDHDDDARFGRVSLTIAVCVWAFMLVAATLYYVLYKTSWSALFLYLFLAVPAMKAVPFVAAIGLYFGVKGLEALDDRKAPVGLWLNVAACVVGAIFLFTWNT